MMETDWAERRMDAAEDNWPETHERRQRRRLKIGNAFRNIHRHKSSVPMKYVAEKIPDLLALGNFPQRDPYMMIADAINRTEFTEVGTDISRVWIWSEDVTYMLTGENFERVLEPVVDALGERHEGIKFLIDQCWTRWDVLDRWCDLHGLPRIERLNKPNEDAARASAIAELKDAISTEQNQTALNEKEIKSLLEAKVEPGFNQDHAVEHIKSIDPLIDRQIIRDIFNEITGRKGRRGRLPKISQK